MDMDDLRVALFSGNYNYVRDGANQALNRLVDYLLRQGARVRVYSPKVEEPAFECAGELTEISWRDTGTHLCCASADNSFYVIDRTAGTTQRVEGYPAPVANARFSKTGNALVTSGAYRLAGWDADDLPQNDLPGKPIATGKPGFVVLNTIATHPKRDVVATGYASGLVTLANVGTPQDMMLHQERGAEVGVEGAAQADRLCGRQGLAAAGQGGRPGARRGAA